jgi:hypothetical protein
MKSLKKEFPNQVYSLNAPASSYSTEILKSELKSLRRCWMINLKLNHTKSVDSLMKCINEISGELKLRSSQGVK